MLLTRSTLNERTDDWETENVWVNPAHVAWVEEVQARHGPRSPRTVLQLTPPLGQIEVTDVFGRVSALLTAHGRA